MRKGTFILVFILAALLVALGIALHDDDEGGLRRWLASLHGSPRGR